MKSKLLQILNRNMPKEDEYTVDELKKAFSIKSYNDSTERTKQLFIRFYYDMKKKGFTNTDIIYELSKFHSDKETAISENTIKKYFSIAKKYIDKKQYIELITGKKNSC